MGRKLTLTDKLIKEFAQIIKEGNNYNTAYEYLGIPHDTYYSWLRRADEAELKKGKLTKTEELYINFAHTIREARMFAKRRHQNVISKLDPKKENWLKSKWWLERNYPKEYGEQTKIDINETKNVNISIKESIDLKMEISNEKAERIRRIVADLLPTGRAKLTDGGGD